LIMNIIHFNFRISGFMRLLNLTLEYYSGSGLKIPDSALISGFES